MYSNYFFMSTAAFIKEKTGYILYLIFVPGVLNIILAFCLIPLWGYTGAAFAMLIANWSTSLIPLFVKFYKDEIKYMLGSIKPLFYIFGINIILFTISLFLKDSFITIKILTTCFSFFFAFLYYRKIIITQK